MLVIAPASDISRLGWLTNDEDDARNDAAERADELGRRRRRTTLSPGSVIQIL
jgi:hypothetical protein